MMKIKTIGAMGLAVAMVGSAFAWSHSPSSQSFGTSGGSFTLAVSGSENYDWNAGSSESWITVSRLSATTFSVSVAANTGSDERRGNVTINAFQKGTSASAQTWVSMQSCGITQAGTGDTPVRSISPLAVTFEKTGGTESVSVTVPSGESWSVSGGADWLTTSVSSGTGSSSITVSATSNTGVEPRSATLLIAGQPFSVYQSGESGYSRITYSNLKGATHSNPSYYKEGESVTFTEPTPVEGYVFAGWTPAQINTATTGDVEIMASWSPMSDCSITIMSAEQRWPWNGKVDIQYCVAGNLQKFASKFGYTLSLLVSAKDLENSTTYRAKTLAGDTSLDEGMHSVTWDLDVDEIALKSTNVEFSVSCLTNAHPYCVIDISGGMDADEFPVSYLDEVPDGTWSQEYKTKKIVLRRVEGSDVKTFTDTWSSFASAEVEYRPYYIGIFEFTHGQAAQLGYNIYDYSPEDLAEFLKECSKRPVETWWKTYRGTSIVCDSVTDDSLLGKLNSKTKLKFDIPKGYQWVVANMADSVTSSYNFFDDYEEEPSDYAWFGYDSLDAGIHDVGTKLPNSWGLYDTAGNVDEFYLSKWGDGTYAQYGYFCTYGGDCCAKQVSDLSWRSPGGALAAALRLTWTLPEDELAAALPSSKITGINIDTINVSKAPINTIMSVGDSSISVSSTWGETWLIYYTTDGSTPTTASSVYTDCITVGIKGVTIIKTIAISPEGKASEVATLEIPAAPTPTIEPADRTIISGKSVNVNISCNNKDATIYCTTDGSEPTTSSPVYKRFKASTKMTVKAIAVVKDMAWSETATASYAFGTCADPVISPTDGTVFDHSNLSVSINWDSSTDGTLRYTTDGSEPTAASPAYTQPFAISETTTVKAKVFSDTYFDSAVVSATLTRVWNKVATPVISAPGVFSGSGAEVSITCATDGASVYYTTDGSEPNSHSKKYTAPFSVTATTRIRAIAIKSDWTKSDIADVTTSKEWSIGDSLGDSDRVFSTDATTGWVRDQTVSKDGYESMRSGAIGNSSGGYVESTISTVVSGKGTVSFWWKASCEEDEDYEWDHAEFRVNGKVVDGIMINGITDWRQATYKITTDGEHTLTWAFLKDDYDSEGEDCIWLDGVTWTAAEPQAPDHVTIPENVTGGKAVEIPLSWAQQFPGFTEKFGSDMAKVMLQPTKKRDGAGNELQVWHDYVAGTDPTDSNDVFRVTISIEDGVPVLSWQPDLNTNAIERTYQTYGRSTLSDETPWETPADTSRHHFFKVTVGMP